MKESEAERFLREIRERLEKLGLELQPERTRLIGFGRVARPKRRKRGEGGTESFAFPGFKHSCGTNSRAHFRGWRRTVRKRLEAKLQQIRQTLRARMHKSA